MSSALCLVAWRRNGLAMLADPRTFENGAGDVANPDSSSCVSALGVPKRRSVVDSRAVMTLSLLRETPPFIGPNLVSLDN